MGQDLVELRELLQLPRGLVQAVQPLRVAPDLQEVVHVQVDQIGTLVSGCRLRNQRRQRRRARHAELLKGPGEGEGGGCTQTHHDADVVSVVQRQGSVHLQQVVLRPEEALQVVRVEAHHHGNVVQTTERRKRVLKYRLRPVGHFTDF